MDNRCEDGQKILEQANGDDPHGVWAYHLANAYRFGQGINKDSDQAITWFKKAADKGYADAYSQIGLMYSYGEVSGSQDETEALKYYLLAIENSIDGEIDPHSYQAAALAYCYGEGAPQNPGKAVIMGRKALNGYQTYKNGAFKDLPEVNVAKVILAKALLQVGETSEAATLLSEARNSGESEVVNLATELLEEIKEEHAVIEDEYILSGNTLTIRAFNTSIYVDVPSIIEKNSNSAIDTLVFEEGIETIVGANDLRYEGPSCIHTIVFPKSLISIGYHAFAGYAGLVRLEFPKSLTSIGEQCFSKCTTLEEVRLPERLTELGKYAFSGCISLKSIFLPNSLVNIQDGVFNDCRNLSQIIIPEGVVSIGDFAFSGTGIRSMDLPSSLKTIGGCAFGIAPEMHVNIPQEAPVFTSHAFLEMEDLPYYTVVGTNQSIKPDSHNTRTDVRSSQGEKRMGRLIAFWVVIALCAIINVGLLFDLAIIAIIAAAVYRKKNSLPWGLFSGDLWKYIWKTFFYK